MIDQCMADDLKLVIDPLTTDDDAQSFCREFLEGSRPRYILGRSLWANSIAENIEVDGFVDDFTAELEHCGRPIIRRTALPQNAMVVCATLGRPLTAEDCIAQQGVQGIDYYSFKQYSGLPLKGIGSLDAFPAEYDANTSYYHKLHSSLADDISRAVLARLINFRLSKRLSYLHGFVEAQHRQYFEPFLGLNHEGETFIDVGCYDGFTTEEFIKRCPSYCSIHILEPEPTNLQKVRSRLERYPSIHYHPVGASDHAQVLRFQSSGSASAISSDGEMEIQVDRIDSLIQEAYTFLKMDIEGGEYPALLGAKDTILEHHPRLAISVYHRADDLRTIPDLVLSFREDYDLYLRHYTEGMDETVMFFLPRR